MDEAKSKLTSGSLKVNAYYGSNRCRDPDLLADNDIVVTTYQILSSDAARYGAENGIEDEDETEDGNALVALRYQKRNPAPKKVTKREWKALNVGEHAHPLSKVHW
jgi:hypothetical protein